MTKEDQNVTNQAEQSAAVSERRIVPRIPVEIPISYLVLAGVNNESDSGQGFLQDLSIAGAAFCGDKEFPLQTTLRLVIPISPVKLPESTDDRSVESRQIKGQIVNCRQTSEGQWRYGIKFDKLYYTLAEWIKELASYSENQNFNSSEDLKS